MRDIEEKLSPKNYAQNIEAFEKYVDSKDFVSKVEENVTSFFEKPVPTPKQSIAQTPGCPSVSMWRKKKETAWYAPRSREPAKEEPDANAPPTSSK